MIFTVQVISIVLSLNVIATPDTDDETLQALKACSALKNDITRLGCYDSILRAPMVQKKAEKAKANFGLKSSLNPLTAPAEKPTAPKSPTIKETKKEVPFEQASKKPSMAKRILDAFLKKDLVDDKITSLTIEMVSHKKNLKGKYVFKMKDGSLWRQTDDMRRPLKKGPFMVTIKEGTFGSYIMRPEKGNWSVRVKRTK